MNNDNRALAWWNLAASCCVGSALLLVLALTGWGAYVDFAEVRTTLLQGETNRLRSHAVRTVGRIQDHLASRRSNSLEALRQDDQWLRAYWERWLPGDQSRLYAAVVDRNGTIVMHNVPQREGIRLDADWYLRQMPEAGEDVVETSSSALTGGELAYDVCVPIIHQDDEIGSYRSGLNAQWFATALAEKNRLLKQRWALLVAAMVIVVVVAAVSLHHIIRRTVALREAIEVARVRQFAELGELAAGIAHEIRNPINAIRLNLHALVQLEESPQAEPEGEPRRVIAEANREIDRIEDLIRIMLRYARPDKAQNEAMDARAELEGAIDFLRPVLDADRIELIANLGGMAARVRMDRNRYRQLMLNVLRNGREAVGPGGRIEIQLGCRRGIVEITVADNGPGVPAAEREQIFDPFYSTKESGTGLGLALAKRFVEEAGGRICCEAAGLGGALFRVALPEAVERRTGARS